MNDSVKELCIDEKGKLSAKNLRAFLSDNLKNEKLVLYVGAFDSTFENDIDYIVKLIEDNTYYVRNLLKLLVESEDLKPDNIDIIYKASSSMGTTYLRLRNLCELTQGKYGINLKTRNPVEISAFLNEFIKTVHNCLPVSMCRNITLRNNVRSDLYASINQTGLTHILVNLLVNALVHSHSENRKVDIILNSFQKENAIAISVVDYGIGVDLKKIHAIMERNINDVFDGSKTLLRSYKGYGLLVCQKLAGNMDGKILVSNIKEGGSVFTVVLNLTGKEKNGEFLRLRDSSENDDTLVDVELIALALYQIIKNEKLV